MNDLFQIARGYYNRATVEELSTSPGAYWDGVEYYTLSPLRADNTIGSFHISETGMFYDHATDDKGDLIDLVAARDGVSKVEAAKTVIKAGGGVVPDYDGRGQKKEFDRTPVVPIPSSDPEMIKQKLLDHIKSSYNRTKYGHPVKTYPYKNPEGETLMMAIRYEKEDGKNVIPCYYTKSGVFTNGIPKTGNPRYPYRSERLAGNELPVLIVEGEKCGDVKVPGFVVLSWLGGSSRAHQTDWSILQGREVSIFPDIDSQRDKKGELLPTEKQPGIKAALEIKRQIPNAKILDVYGYKPIEENPDGWDIADAAEEGIEIPEIICGMGTIFDTYVSDRDDTGRIKIDTWKLYKKFVDDRYGLKNVDQFTAIFFLYRKERFFWQKIELSNIKCDVQTWMEDTGLLQMIEKSRRSVPKVVSEINQYLTRHSTGYRDDNPFSESGTSPWIHHLTGAVRIKVDGFDFHSREEEDESFFRDLRPLHCLNYGIDEELYHGFDMQRDCPAFLHYIRGVIPERLAGDEEEEQKTIDFFAQVLAYCFTPIKKDEFFFALTGQEGNGKSFFIEIIKELIGAEFIVERKTEDMKSRFAASDLFGAKIFVDPDMAANEMLPDGFIKSYAGNKQVTIEEKYEKAVTAAISIAMFFVSNHQFRTPASQGINRRIILIPFENKIKNRDKRLLDKIIGRYAHGSESGDRQGDTFDERPAIFAMALKGWLRFVKNNHSFSLPDWLAEAKEDWKIESNTVAYFLRKKINEGVIEKEPIKGSELFKEYVELCESENLGKHYGKKRFFNEIRVMEDVKEVIINNTIHFRIKFKNEGFDFGSDEQIPF